MKHRLFLLLLSLCASFSMMAQSTPQGFNYQSIVRDNATGMPATNKTVTLLFSVRSGAPNGQVAYSEKQVTSTNEYGLINLVVGQGGTPLVGTFDAINWGGGAKWLTVSIETAPNVFDELGSSQLMSVPYALYAKESANTSGGNDDWGKQTAFVGPTLSGNGLASNPLNIAKQNAQTGQVLKWDGSTWAPANDTDTDTNSGGTVTQINTGTGLTGGPITTNGTISLANTAVTPGQYGSKTKVPVLTIDPQGRITNVFIESVEPGAINLIGGAGIGVQQSGFNYTVTNTGDVNAADDLLQSTVFSGDVTGTYTDIQIRPNTVGNTEIIDNSVATAKLANGAVTAPKLSDMGAASGQVLKWNGTAWAPAADNAGAALNLTAGSGINITGAAPNLTIVNAGDANAADDITTTSTANGDVTGVFSNLQIKADVVTSAELADNAVETANLANQSVTAGKIDDMGAANGQVLKWNGTTWAPAADATGNNIQVLAGAGIDVTQAGNNFIVINTGDTDVFDDLTKTTSANGDVSGTFDNLQLKPLVVTSTELAVNAVTTTNVINGAITGAKLNNMGAGVGQTLKWNGSTWAPADDNAGGGGLNLTAGPGISITGTSPNLTINNTGDTNAGDDLTNASNAGGDVTGVFTNLQIKPDAVGATEIAAKAVTGSKIDDMGASNGQVLKWNGTTWAPADDNTGGGGGSIITNATLTGAGKGASPLGIAQQGATAGQVLRWNGTVWLPAAVPGDNWGTQAASTNATLSGNGTSGNPLKIAQQNANTGEVLSWNGSTWAPSAVSGDDWGTQVVIPGASLVGDGTSASPLILAQQGATNGQVLRWSGSAWLPATVPGDNWGTQTAATNATLAGNGTNASPLRVAQQNALVGEVLKWNGNTWAPAKDEVGTGGGTNNNYTAGSGISITGTAPNFVINNIGDADNNPSNEIQALSLTGNQLSLSQGGGTVTLPNGTNYAAGTGISFTGAAPNVTINNSGDLSNTNEIQTLGLAGNTLSLSLGGGSVTLPTPVANNYSAGSGISITGSAPNFTIVNTGDADKDPTNELQNLSLVGSVLTISGTGSNVDLGNLPGGSGFWKLNGDHISNTNTGNVIVGSGLGAGPSNAKLQVTGDGTGEAASISQGSGTDAALFVHHAGTGPAIVTQDGFVGIHTPTPAFQLDVEGDGHFKTANTQLTLENPGTAFARMTLKNTGIPGGWNIVGKNPGNTTEFGIELNKGLVGIRAFTAKLDSGIILGSATSFNALKAWTGNKGFTMENANNKHSWEFWVTNTAGPNSGNLALYNDQLGNLVPAGTFAINGLYTPSDSRLKKDVSAVETGVLSKMMQLRPVSYRYKAEAESAKRSLGFLAQDVQTVFPELVGESPARDGSSTYLSLNYSGFGVLAVKAVQEQQTEIEKLQREKKDLQQQVESLETRLKRLEDLAAPKK